MSWGIAGNWLAVVGLAFLTFGTRAQARASLAEFNKLKRELAERRVQVLAIAMTSLGNPLVVWPAMAVGYIWSGFRNLYITPEILEGIRAKNGDEAVQFVLFRRQALIWTILNIGSTIALIAAVIQLALGYQ
jgi:hypothetical protein